METFFLFPNQNDRDQPNKTGSVYLSIVKIGSKDDGFVVKLLF